MLPKTLKNFTLFVDGVNHAGKIDEIELPKITEATEEHRAGDMDAPVEIGMGLEAMTASMTFAEYAAALFAHFGWSPAKTFPSSPVTATTIRAVSPRWTISTTRPTAPNRPSTTAPASVSGV